MYLLYFSLFFLFLTDFDRAAIPLLQKTKKYFHKMNFLNFELVTLNRTMLSIFTI